ncbi:M56 family metallopeptidase [Chitinimonas koreensis]|uniref:M56 family metallopeptidase n=1 Tax=Chitinimonas koreensis TaxID=356302 RepID=UPI000408A366|nr:M56 family metallopeptidase [Chitinimonas koreensis]QNM96594.1 M48 family metalloprotease [Chitinimonas koreensis]
MLALQQWHAALGGVIVQSLFQLTALGMAAALALACIDRRRAGLRHAVGMAFLLAMAAAPIASFLQAIPSAAAQGGGIWQAPVPAAAAVDVLPPAVQAALPASGWLAWLWYFGVSAMLARLALGMRQVGQLGRAASQPLPAHWQRRVEDMARAMGIRREIRVRLTGQAGMPCTAHAWRPLIWLPARMLSGLAPDQLEAVLAHELAHIRRLDWLWNGLQCAIEAILFYHPAVWWLSRQIRQDREHACDDLAVAACTDPIALAEALVSLERGRQTPRLALAADGGSLRQRVERLLGGPAAPAPGWQRSLLPICLVGAVLLLGAQASIAGTEPGTRGPAASRQATTSHIEIDDGNIHIATTEDGQSREYRRAESGSGTVSESYRVGGKPAAIDAAARKWIDARIQAAVQPPPEPPAVPEPPAPPAPPEPPSMADNGAYKEAVRLALADPALQARLGAPLSAGTEVNGSIQEHDWAGRQVGSADLYIPLRGPKGSATVHAVGGRVNGAWRFAPLQLESVALR